MSGSVPEGSVRNTHMAGRSQVGSGRLENLRSEPFFPRGAPPTSTFPALHGEIRRFRSIGSTRR
jgi:hypothetical protein